MSCAGGDGVGAWSTQHPRVGAQTEGAGPHAEGAVVAPEEPGRDLLPMG